MYGRRASHMKSDQVFPAGCLGSHGAPLRQHAGDAAGWSGDMINPKGCDAAFRAEFDHAR
jgi:hypothetical protein